MKNNKRILFSIIATLSLSALPVFAASNQLFTDNFSSLTQVDTTKTTAYVDTTNHLVEAFHTPASDNISTASSNNTASDILVADSSGIEWYTLDQSTGKYVKNTALSSTAYTNPLGVSLVSGSNTYYVWNKNGSNYEVHQVVFNGSQAVDNPFNAVTGLTNVMSFSSIDTNSFAEADQTGNVTVYTYDSTQSKMVKDVTHSFSTGLNNIVSVRNIPNTLDFFVVTSNGAYCYVFDQSTSTYMQNNAYSVSSTSQVVAGTVDSTGNMVDLLGQSQSNSYMYDQSSNTMQQANLYTVGSITSPLAVSLPSSTSEVIASINGTVNTYNYDASTNTTINDPNLQISGLTFNTGYNSPSVYQSKQITTATPNNMFRVVPTENNDSNTSIQYAISTDGGTTFTTVPANTWTHLPVGSTNPPANANITSGPFVVRATLTTTNPQNTARLTAIELDGYLDVTPPSAPGQPTASPNPSGSTSTTITWAPSTDTIQAPSTGASGVSDYLIQFSYDGGTTWRSWINTNSSNPSYTITVPTNTVETINIKVRAMDLAGNYSAQDSPIGQVFIDTKPLKMDSLQVTQITAPGPKQTAALPTDPPVYVQTGGGATIQIKTEGGAQSVTMKVLGNIPAGLYSSNPVNLVPSSDPTVSDTNTWTGQYLVPQTYSDGSQIPEGTPLQATFTINGLNGQVITQTITVVITNQSVQSSSQGTKVHLG